MKRKNLQCFTNLEPSPKRIKHYDTIFRNTLKRKISYSNISNISNISTFSLSQSINEIDHNDKVNKICQTFEKTNFKDKQEQSDLDYLKEYYFLYQ
jgi:hypothetical protein